MAKRSRFPRIDRCPQCDFRFRGRPEDHQHPSPLGRKLYWSGYLVLVPVMLGVAAFLALTRGEDGRMIDFTGRANTIMLAIFTPSLVLFMLSHWVPKRVTYRCPQCSWERTFKPDQHLEPTKTDTPASVEADKKSEDPG
jgi:hypothetical protein